MLELLESHRATDLVVDGARSASILVDRTWRAIDVPFETDRELVGWARELLESCGQRLDSASPFADGYVSIGSSRFRVHAVLASGVSSRTQVSVRRHGGSAESLDELVVAGRLAGRAADWFRGVVQRRESFLISGATGAGKTTLLSAVLNEARDERVIVIEDTPELAVTLPWVIGLCTRAPNVEGVGLVSASDLVRQTLRMRPDRVTLGEVRGGEIAALVEALASGHPGGGSTIHAGSLEHVATRLEGLLSPVACSWLPALIPWVVHLDKSGGAWRFEVGRFQVDVRGRLCVERLVGADG
ncbi:MAG: ATPase [Phenylobacterium zucineum]|nr:MAG: ATPase [Phenylobacterium zucineum]